jgi:hypothetical protein
MKKSILVSVVVVASVFFGSHAFSQQQNSPATGKTSLFGVVVDADTKEPLVGTLVWNPTDKTSAITDLEGNFRLKGESTTELTFSFMGYQTQSTSVSPNTSVTIELKSETVFIKSANVIGDVAIHRKTPVAVSTITPEIIQERLGTQEFPEVLKTTPGIYATKQGGGYGDARINLRGFEAANTAVMVNGVPVNDMEWGGVYWSNWAGLADVTRSMQVQRGLGASKVAAPSVGGSINILTKTTDAVLGGSASYTLGNDGYNKIGFSVSSGLTKKGWAITLLGSKTWGDGYILGTEFEGYSWFANISYKINDKHTLALTGFGAPQWHNQRYSGDKLLIGEYEQFKEKYRYNSSFGQDYNGIRHNSYYNYYHKPQISLNHYWDIDEKSSLSTVLYTSIGRGGGYSGRGNNSSDLYGTSGGRITTKYRTADNYFDFGALMADNAANPNGSQAVIASSTNDHNWYGLLSTYTHKFNIGEKHTVDFYAGLDGRYYEGIHQAYIMDLLGGEFFIDPYRSNTNYRGADRNTFEYKNEKLKEGDLVYRDNTCYVAQEGVFAQAEYDFANKVNAFIAASIANQTYWRVGKFYYDNERSDIANRLGFTVKGGVNYNINKFFNVFGNIGYISRNPFSSGGIFLSNTTSNGMNPNPQNEKIFSKELGANFKTSYFTANLNLYHTNWNDKTTVRAIDASNPDKGVVNLTGVNATHQGIELEILAIPFKALELKGMLSFGDWRWKDIAEGYAYNKDGFPVDANGNLVNEAGGPDHAKVILNMNNAHVGNAAQFTAAIGASYAFFGGALKIGTDVMYYGRNYSNYTMPTGTFNQEVNVYEPWRIPDAWVVDAFARYTFNIGRFNATLNANVNNLFNEVYIADANDGSDHTANTATVLYCFGRTMSVGLKIHF